MAPDRGIPVGFTSYSAASPVAVVATRDGMPVREIGQNPTVYAPRIYLRTLNLYHPLPWSAHHSSSPASWLAWMDSVHPQPALGSRVDAADALDGGKGYMGFAPSSGPRSGTSSLPSARPINTDPARVGAYTSHGGTAAPALSTPASAEI